MKFYIENHLNYKKATITLIERSRKPKIKLTSVEDGDFFWT